MKKTIIYSSIAALMAMVSSLDAGKSIMPDPPFLLAASDDPASNNAKKPSHSVDTSKQAAHKRKPLEPAIHNTVKGLVNTSHEGLVEEITNKGVEMRLKGRFRTAPVATIEEDGAITIRDYTSVPPTE